MAKLREASLMEGKFFIEMGQIADGSSELSWEKKESNGGHIKMQDDEGDSDDEEETRKPDHPFTDGDETNSEKENSQLHRDSGIDSLLLLETGTPENEDDDDDDQAFRRVVYSKRRRGSRGGEKKRPESWSHSLGFASSIPTQSATASMGSEKNKSDADGSENEVATESTTKQKKRKKRKNKKRAAAVSVDEHCADDWDQLDLVDDDDDDADARATTIFDRSSPCKGALAMANGRTSVADKTAKASLSPEIVRDEPEGDGDKDIFEERPANGSFKSCSLSESYDNKAGIKSILKNRSRTFSGESSCSEAVELASSVADKRDGFSSRKHSSSLTSVTQSLESLSITSMLTSDSCCEEGLEDRCEHHQQYCASWSSNGTRKSVHFSAVIDRKRFRSGAPPQNVGKGRRNSGGGKSNQRQEHGKKRHLSEGDAATTLADEKKSAEYQEYHCAFNHAASLEKENSDARSDSPNGDQVSVSSDDLFQMEELDEFRDEAGDGNIPGEITGACLRELLGIPEEKEEKNDADGCECAIVVDDVGGGSEAKGAKRGKKHKSKKGKGKASSRAEDVCRDDHDGWSTVGGHKLGRGRNGSTNSSDLSLSDVDDGHSIYTTEGASDIGAISIMDVESVAPIGQKVS